MYGDESILYFENIFMGVINWKMKRTTEGAV